MSPSEHKHIPRELHDGHSDGLQPLASLDLSAIGSVDALVRGMGNTAFGGRNLGEASGPDPGQHGRPGLRVESEHTIECVLVVQTDHEDGQVLARAVPAVTLRRICVKGANKAVQPPEAHRDRSPPSMSFHRPVASSMSAASVASAAKTPWILPVRAAAA